MVSTLIVLVGPMGAGKSTIGRMLAAKIGYEFQDTDHIIEDRTGADIAWIFDVEGEAGFRARERQVLAEFSQADQTVLATGGGIVADAENRTLLESIDCVIYLRASVDQLVARTAKDKKRPLLQVPDPQAKIISLMEEREPFYLSVANHVIETDGQGPKATVQKILSVIQDK